MTIGYEYLRQTLDLKVLEPRRKAAVHPVTRIIADGTSIKVPASVAPSSDDPLEHILFALKHEGTNLQVLASALPRIPADRLREELRRTRTGAYIRAACHLWEVFTGRILEDIPAIDGPTVPLFHPDHYYTDTSAARDPKWRVLFNGLGTHRYCATIERTPTLEGALRGDVLERAKRFVADNKGKLVERALEWAYLHETQESFAIEKEVVGPEKQKRFVALLQQAHDRAPLTEEYLVGLQNDALTNPREHAVEFRHETNWLGGAGRGPASVTYVPPPHLLCRELMHELMGFVNARATAIPAILMASIAKFGFVFLHPFMDGNGRLSRFLFHKALCLSGRMENGLLLPVSVAMHRNEAQYLSALQSYSRPVRELWDVRYAGDEAFDFTFSGNEAVYRFWDATDCAEFGARMADQALESELIAETDFLRRFDRILRKVNETHDVRTTLLNPLIAGALENQGVISKAKRKRTGGMVPDEVFTLIESLSREELQTAGHLNSSTADDEPGFNYSP